MPDKLTTLEDVKLNGDQPSAPMGNGVDPDAGIEAIVEAATRTKAQRLAAMLQAPPTELTTTLKQALIPVGNPGGLEFIRTHPDLRLVLNMCEPKKGPGSLLYAVMPEAEKECVRLKLMMIRVVLYPIMIAAAVPTYRLVPVKVPSESKRLDDYSLTRKVLLEKAVDQWLAIRYAGTAYFEGEPDAAAVFPDVVFPDWSPDEWLDRSLIQADQVFWNADHPMLRAARGLT